MKQKVKNVKEIVLKTHFISMKYSEDYYNSELSVTRQGAVYVRKGINFDYGNTRWSYESNRKEHEDKFERIIYCFKRCMENNDGIDFYVSNTESFIISLKYVDGTEEEYEFDGNLGDNGFGELAICFLNIVPPKHQFPDSLCFCTTKTLNNKVLANINNEEIVSLMVADFGAMGSPGEIELVTYDYKTYTRYSGNELLDEDVYQGEVLAKFESLFDDINYDHMINSFQILNAKHYNWLYLNLGFGNHLYLREDLYRKLQYHMLPVEKDFRYGAWKKMVCDNV